MATVAATLPVMVTAQDYHDFKDMEDAYRSIGLDVRVNEVGFQDGTYYGVVTNDMVSEEEVNELFEDYIFD